MAITAETITPFGALLECLGNDLNGAAFQVAAEGDIATLRSLASVKPDVLCATNGEGLNVHDVARIHNHSRMIRWLEDLEVTGTRPGFEPRPATIPAPART